MHLHCRSGEKCVRSEFRRSLSQTFGHEPLRRCFFFPAEIETLLAFSVDDGHETRWNVVSYTAFCSQVSGLIGGLFVVTGMMDAIIGSLLVVKRKIIPTPPPDNI